MEPRQTQFSRLGDAPPPVWVNERDVLAVLRGLFRSALPTGLSFDESMTALKNHSELQWIPWDWDAVMVLKQEIPVRGTVFHGLRSPVQQYLQNNPEVCLICRDKDLRGRQDAYMLVAALDFPQIGFWAETMARHCERTQLIVGEMKKVAGIIVATPLIAWKPYQNDEG